MVFKTLSKIKSVVLGLLMLPLCGMSYPVNSVTDLSGNNETLYPNPSETPPVWTSNCTNGLGCVNFNGYQILYTKNDANFSRLLLSASTVFIVSNTSSAGADEGNFWSGVSDYQRYSIEINTCNGFESCFDYGFDSANRLLFFTPTTNVPHVYNFYATYTTTQVVRVDGTQVGTLVPASFTTYSCNLSLGAHDNCTGGTITGSAMTGNISEVLVYNVQLSATNYQAVELYLGCKYGLNGTGGLPATCTGIVQPSTITGLSAWYDFSNYRNVLGYSNPIFMGGS